MFFLSLSGHGVSPSPHSVTRFSSPDVSALPLRPMWIYLLPFSWFASYTWDMVKELTINVDDSLYALLKPMVEQDTIGEFLSEALQRAARPVPDIRHLWGTLHPVDMTDVRDEEDRAL